MPIFRTGTIVGAQQAAEGWPAEEPIPDLPRWDGGPVPKVNAVPPPATERAPRLSVLGFGALFGLALAVIGIAASRRGRA